MPVKRVPVLLSVFSGTFASQPVAFACLVDQAEKRGLDIDLGDVDVIQHSPEVRLAHYFRPAIVARIQEAQGADNTVIVLRPTRLAVERDFPTRGSPLRMLGRFAGEIVEPEGAGDWA